MKREHLPLRRAIARLLIAGQVVLYLPGGLWAAPERELPPGREAPPRVRPNRTVPKVDRAPLFPVLSASPTDHEITRARVFEEPLVPIGKAAPGEAAILARALAAYQRKGGGEQTEDLLAFLEGRYMSPWRASLLLNLGIVARRTGYYTRAMRMWEEAWGLAKGATDQKGRAVADRAVGELARLSAGLGNRKKLEQILGEVEGRDIGGSAGEMVAGARSALWVIQNRPEKAYRCGPLAIDRMLAFQDPGYRRPVRITSYAAGAYGTTLVQMRDLGNELGLDLRLARRVDRGAEVLVPAVVHWDAGHFTAMVKEKDGRYLLHDPTFGEELWISRKALNDESSGYMLVREGPLPAGWRAVPETEAEAIWGKGPTQVSDTQNQKCNDHKSGGCQTMCRKRPPQSKGEGPCPCEGEPGDSPPNGLAHYSFHTMLVNLHITDTPVGYSPPRGSAIGFAVTYNQREVFQPQIFSYGNVGPKWNYGWQSYLEDDPTDGNQPANLYVRGGGQETYTGYDPGTGAYGHHTESRAQVVRVSDDPIRYERRMGDGSVDVYAQPDGAITFPRKVFLTESSDPQGNTVTFTYDASLRLVAVTDAIGQVTTLAYEHPTEPLKITKVTDPFGRFATLEYDASGRLFKITDVIGLVSEFEYGPGDFIQAMTTPYGTTTFASFDEGRRRWIEATDPLGGKERLEYLNRTIDGLTGRDLDDFPYGLGGDYPDGFYPGAAENQSYRNTFFWDKRASALYPGDYTKAKLIHWLHGTSLSITAGVIENEKEPLETMRTFYKYPNMGWEATGSHATPSAIGHKMEDGTSQIREFEYNASGKTIKSIDPLDRETVYVYGTGSTPDANPVNGTGMDLLEVKQKNGAVYDTLWSATYNAQHLPLTVTDAAGQTTTYTYNAAGQVLTVTTPERAGIPENRTTTYVYDADGYLQSITGPAPGSTTGFTYDGYGRVETVTSSDGDTVTYDYDDLGRLTKVTYPDTTYEETQYERLDPVRRRDREGRWSETFYNALRQVVSTRDAAGRTPD